MKKLGKLSINQSKLLENEELVKLRGGYFPPDSVCCYVYVYGHLINCGIKAPGTDCEELRIYPEYYVSSNSCAACVGAFY